MTQERLGELADRLAEVEGYLHVDESRALVSDLERRSTEPGFWDDANAARQTMARLAKAKDDVAGIEAAHAKLDDAQAAFELGAEMGDDDLFAEAEATAASLEHDLSELELTSWFTGEFDQGDAIVSVTPGQGGLEAQDWCSMLLHMYLRYCERRGWKVTVNDAPAAEVIGIDRATFTVSGKNAYGMLRAEQGVHRLVRISPTDAKKRRQTTFAGVEVLPVLPDDIEVKIAPDEIRVDVYLRSKLYELELQKRAEALDELRGPKHDIGFGNQIRSYVLYPYQMVKDLRTGCETGNVDSVLSDGDLDPFVTAYHRWVVGGREPVSVEDEQ